MTVSSADPIPVRPRYVLALDGVRGLAILAVMAFHLYSPAGSWTTRVTAYGALGVNLFFALSGFLITGILLDAKGSVGYFKNFYARRALRIWPLYYATLFVLLLVIPAVHPVHDDKYLFSIQHQASLWLYLNNFYEAYIGRAIPLFGHFWSLAVEEQFYLVWPFLVLVLSRRSLQWLCVACIIESLLARFGLVDRGMDPAIALRITFCALDSLAVGAAIAVLRRDAVTLQRLRVPGLLGFAAAALCTVAQFLSPRVERSAFGFAISGTIWSFAFGGVLIAALGAYGQRWTRLFEIRSLRFLGKYSYGIYVFHWPIGRAFTGAFPTVAHTHSVGVALMFAVVQMAAAVGVAFISWHLFEQRFLALKRFFHTSRSDFVGRG